METQSVEEDVVQDDMKEVVEAVMESGRQVRKMVRVREEQMRTRRSRR